MANAQLLVVCAGLLLANAAVTAPGSMAPYTPARRSDSGCIYRIVQESGANKWDPVLLTAVFPNVTGDITNTTFANCTEESGDTRLATTINLSNQSVATIQSGAFAVLLSNSAFSDVTSLDLSQNELTQLGSQNESVFKGLNNLTDSMSLAGNQLRVLQPGVFAEVPRLKRLDLSANYIDTVQTNTFQGLSSLVFLHLEGNGIRQIDVSAFQNLSSLGYLHLQCACSSSGWNHGWAEDSASPWPTVCGYSFFRCNKLQSLQKGAFNGLGQLTRLNLAGSQLASLEDGVFRPLGSLQQLWLNCGSNTHSGELSCNQLQHLSSQVFDGLGSLNEILNLRGNQLASLEGGVFKSLNNLMDLHMECDYVAYQKEANGYDSGVEQVHSACNQLRYLTAEVFKGLDSLETLDVSGNQLTNLPTHVFKDLPKLQELWLGCTTGEFSTLSEGGATTIFSISCNQIATIAAGAFDGLNSLAVLALDGNHLTSLDEMTFQGLDELLVLNLVNNTIKSLSPGAFSQLQALLQLDLDLNRISHLNSTTFVGLSSLEYLRITNNWITVINKGTWDPLPTAFKFFVHVSGEPTVFETGGGCVSWSTCQTWVASHVTCACAADRFSSDFPTSKLKGGDQGFCLCPAGQEYDTTTFTCKQCSVGSYSTYAGSTQCTPCNDTKIGYAYTNSTGSNSSADCVANPQIALSLKLADEKLKAEKLLRQQEEARNSEQSAQASQRLTLLLTFSGIGLALVLLAFAAFVYITKRRKHAVEKKLHETEIALKDATIQDKKRENNFLTDWRIKENDITLEKELARGAEGTVHLGTLKGRVEKVAVKISMLEQKVWREAEVAFMMKLSHPRLVTFLGAGSMKGEQGLMCFNVQEFCTGGSIDNRLWGLPRESVSDLQRVQWACDCSEGIEFIHSRGFTHRDLKSMNVLYDQSSGRAKVADFGMSKKVTTKANRKSTTDGRLEELLKSQGLETDANETGGTPFWMAPELCRAELAIQKRFSDASDIDDPRERATALESARQFQGDLDQFDHATKSDCYAFGVTMFEIISHQPPWMGFSKTNVVYQKVVNGERPELDPLVEAVAMDGWCALMCECWQQEPTDRPDFDAVHARLEEMLHVQQELHLNSSQIAEYDVERQHTFDVDLPSSRPPQHGHRTVGGSQYFSFGNAQRRASENTGNFEDDDMYYTLIE